MENGMNGCFNGWIHTDDFQFAKKLGENSFSIIEITKFPDETYSEGIMNIDIEDYIGDQNFVEKYIAGYGYDSIETVKKQYGKGYKQILAECISETDNLSESTLIPFKKLEEVEKYLARVYGIIIKF